MPRLSELLRNQVTLEVPYRGLTIRVTYLPEKVTSANRARIYNRVAEGEIKADQMDAALIADVVLNWDLTGDDDQPIPVTFEAADGLSTGLQAQIAGAILEDQKNPTRPGR